MGVGSALIGALRVTLGLDSARFEEGSKRAQGQARGLEASFNRLGQRLQGFGTAMTVGVTAPLVAFGTHAVNAASDAQELQSAFNQTFGELAPMMNEWARVTGDAMGRSTQELQNAGNQFGLFFNQAAPTKQAAADLSRQFTVLAQDLASFHNTTADEALLALRSGLSGESEPLRRYGVFLNEAAVQAQALRMGLQPVNGALTDQQKILARSQLILQATTNAQGDVMRTSDSWANRIRASQAAWQELSVTIGTAIIPALTPLLNILGQVLNAFNGLSPSTQNWIVGLLAVGAALGPVLTIIGTLTTLVAPLIGYLGGLATAAIATGGAGGAAATGLTAFGVGLRAIMGVLGPIGLAITAVYLAWENWDSIAPMLSELWSGIQEALGPSFQTLMEGAQELISAIGEVFSQLWAELGPVLQEIGAAFQQIFGGVIGPILRAFGSLVSGIFGVVGNVFKAIAALLRGDFSGAWEAAKNAVKAAWDGIVGIVSNMGQAVLNLLGNLVAGIRDWMVNKLNEIWDWVGNRIEDVKNFFKGLWDAVVGHSYIPDMVIGIGQWMGQLERRMVQPARNATERTRAEFERLGNIIERLFPEETRARELGQDLEFVRANGARLGLTLPVLEEALRRINGEINGTEATTRRLQGIMDDAFPERRRFREHADDVNFLRENYALLGLTLEDVEVAVAALDAKFNRVEEAAEQARDRMGQLMDRAFPQDARARQFADDIAFMRANAEALGIPMERVELAIRNMRAEMLGLPEVVPALEVIRRNMDELGKTINDTFRDGLKGMIRGTMEWEDVMLNAIFAIADALINTLFDALNQTNSAGGGGIGGAIASGLQSILGGLFAKGGRPPMGRVSVVGEEGPELFVPDTAGRVIPNHALGERGGGLVRLMVVPSDYFDAKVEEISGGVVLQNAPSIVGAAQQATFRQLNRRRLG